MTAPKKSAKNRTTCGISLPMYQAVGFMFGNTLKMQDLVREKRFLYHEDYKHEVIASFMSVKKGFTPSTKQITYYSSRSKSLGGGSKHGELFWTAAMVCSGVEGLNHEEDNQSIQFIRA